MEPLSPDTQATLLLVGRFGKGSEAKPLTAAEYRRVAMHLHNLGIRPADLLRDLPPGLPVEAERAQKLLNRGTSLAIAVERWGQLGIKVIGRGDANYPKPWKSKLRGSASPILYVAGDLELLGSEAVCVVGSREATNSGLKFAEQLGRQCAIEALTVVSGDARGVDRAAMEAALDAEGRAIGILIDKLAKAVLGKRHREAILSGQLTLLSPYDPDDTFTVAKAMDRNKYMYALASAAVIVDSETKGGTWTGALENEKHRWTPAFVRLSSDAPEGNRRLAELGLTPISGAPGKIGSLRDCFARSREQGPAQRDLLASDTSKTRVRDEQHHFSSKLYDHFLAELRACLSQGAQSDKTIAKEFDLDVTQAKRWLDRASGDGVIQRLQDPLRYLLLQDAPLRTEE